MSGMTLTYHRCESKRKKRKYKDFRSIFSSLQKVIVNNFVILRHQNMLYFALLLWYIDALFFH